MNKRGNSQRSAKFSRLCLKSKSSPNVKNNSSRRSSEISKYFLKTTETQNNFQHDGIITIDSQDTNDSLYKDVMNIEDVKPMGLLINDEDFKSPSNIKKVSKISMPVACSSKSTKKSSSHKKKTLKNMTLWGVTKPVEDNLRNLDVNAEHLQLALALSKSVESFGQQDEDLPFSTKQNVSSISVTLERFGFKSEKASNVLDRRAYVSDQKKKKKSNYRYITPILFIRTQEDREKLIAEKVSSILSCDMEQSSEITSETIVNAIPASENLQRIHSRDANIFKLNNLEKEHSNRDSFYTPALRLSPTRAKCGHLLKNWHDIPGREVSPVRQRNLLNEQESDAISDDISKNCEETNLQSSEETPELLDVIIGTSKNECIDDTKIIDLVSSDSNLSPKSITQTSSEVQSCNANRSVSPDLFDSDEELSQSLLTLTPTKRKQNKVGDSPTAYTSQYIDPKQSLPVDKETPENDICDLTVSDSEEDNLQNQNDESDSNMSETFFTQFRKAAETVSNRVSSASSLNVTDYIHNMLSESIKSIDCFQNTSSNNPTSLVAVSEQLNLNSSVNNRALLTEVSKQSNLNSPISAVIQRTININEDFISIHDEESNSNVNNEKDCEISGNESDHELPYFKISREKPNTQSAVIYISDSSNDNSEKMETPKFDKSDVLGVHSASQNNVNDSSNEKVKKPSMSKSDASNDIQLSQDSICISDEELNYSSNFVAEDNAIDNDATILYNYSSSFVAENNAMDNNATILYNYSPDRNLAEIPNVVSNTPSTNHLVTDSIPNDISPNLTSFSQTIFDSIKRKSKYFSQCSKDTELELGGDKLDTIRKSLQKSFTKSYSFNDSFDIPENILDCLPSSSNINKSTGQTNVLETSECREKTNDGATKTNEVITPNKTNETPSKRFIIKTTGITPMADYDSMDTPKVAKALQQYGLKRLKRQRGVQLLKYIYENTHPLIQKDNEETTVSDNEDDRIVKRRKKCEKKIPGNMKRVKSMPVSRNLEASEFNIQTDICLSNNDGTLEPIKIVGNLLAQNETDEDLIFEKKQSKKISSCKVPLHIAWHNLVSSNSSLKENILLYEPLQLEVLYSMLKEQGYNYHIQDLMKFLDKKCITIRTNSNLQNKKKK